MENYKLVMPEHLNHFGYLYGGNLLKWVDEISWIAASLDFPGSRFVTIGMDRVEFRKSVREGSILRFDVRQAKRGWSSIQYQAQVFSENIETGGEQSIFNTHVTFVCVDENGDKRVLE